MSRLLAVSLFVVLLFATLLGLSLSLAPGLSVKNAYLYAIIVFLFLRGAVQSHSGGLMEEPIPLVAIHACFLGLIMWAISSWLFMTFVATHIQYRSFSGLMALKGSIVDLYLVFIAFFFSIRTKTDVVWAIKSILTAVVVYNGITFLDAFTGADFGLVSEYEGTKMWGPMGHSNQYGSFIAFFLPTMVAFAAGTQGSQRLLFAVGAALSFILLVATMARGAYLGVAVGTFAAAYLYRAYLPITTYLRHAIYVIPLAVILLVVTGQWETLYTRVVVTTSRAADLDQASSGRLTIWSSVLARQVQSSIALIFGMGWDAYRQSGWFRLSSHNTYLDTYFELGIIGVSLYLATLMTALRSILKVFEGATGIERNLLLGFTIGLCSLVVSLFFGGLSAALLFMWAYIGLATRLAYLIATSMAENADV